METINTLIKGTILSALLFLGACTNYKYIDGGLADGDHDCSMWEYLHTQPDDWDSTILMIEHAGMKEWFDGSRSEKITFFGITNLAIMRFILDHDYTADEADKWHGVMGIPADSCAAILRRLIIPEALAMNDVPRGKLERKTGPDGMYWQKSGGKEYQTLQGKLFGWTYQEDYASIPEGGEVTLRIAREGTNYAGERIVSCNIHTTTGYVHALSYDFRFNNL